MGGKWGRGNGDSYNLHYFVNKLALRSNTFGSRNVDFANDRTAEKVQIVTVPILGSFEAVPKSKFL
jgi:hypothetical protein